MIKYVLDRKIHYNEVSSSRINYMFIKYDEGTRIINMMNNIFASYNFI